MSYSVQMCSVHDVAQKNLEDAIRQVAEIGYKEVEFFHFYKNPVDKVKGWLDECGLTVTAFHAPFRSLFGQFEKTVADYEKIGVKEIVLADILSDTKEDLDYMVASINRWQPELEKRGIGLHFHPHAKDYWKNVDGLIPIKELEERTNIMFQIDSFWAYDAGEDIEEVLEHYKGRMKMMHVKDGIPHTDTDRARNRVLGDGEATVEQALAKAEELGLKIIVESESWTPSGPDEIKRCLEYLNKRDANK